MRKETVRIRRGSGDPEAMKIVEGTRQTIASKPGTASQNPIDRIKLPDRRYGHVDSITQQAPDAITSHWLPFREDGIKEKRDQNAARRPGQPGDPRGHGQR